MKKTLFILAIALCGVLTLSAQKPMRGFVSGGATVGGTEIVKVDASFGMPIAGIVDGHKHTINLPFSQLQRKDFGDVTVMGGTTYSTEPPYFVFDPVKTSDTGVHYNYLQKESEQNLDVLAKITLHVIPCGNDEYAEYTLSTATTSGSHDYETVPIQGASGKYYCWTKSNLKQPGGVVYDNKDDDDAFITTYGRLYTWSEAVSQEGNTVPKNDPITIDGTVYTYVKGICPPNWHIPTAGEKGDLPTDVTTLNHPTLWQGTHPTYTNLTGFTAVPAGMFNDELDRFEGLGTQTDWWTDNDGNVSTTIPVIEFNYYCTSPMDKTQSATKKLSVRCVRENVPVN